MKKLPIWATVFVQPDGLKRPISYILGDNTFFKVDKLVDRQDEEAGACRYTVMVGGHRSYLFEEDGRWSVGALA